MATGGTPPSENMKSDDFRHCCSLCMEPYRGRCPKLLPCFHTFCLPCLTALADNAARSGTGEGDGEKDLKSDDKEEDAESGGEKKTEENEEGTEDKTEDDHHGDTFLCPTCRTPVVIPEGGVAALQTNFYLDVDPADEVEKKGVLCQMCEEGEEKEATHFCLECEQHICRTCKGVHARVPMLRSHRVEPISQKRSTNPAKKPSHGKKWCQYHPDQVLCFHCCKCDVSICLHCKLTSHEGHETEDMVTAARRAREELAGVMAKAKEQLRTVRACINRLERDEQDLHRQKLEIEQQVSSRHEVVVIWADRARDEVLENLAGKAETVLNDITMEKTSAGIAMETISEVMTRASVKTTYGPDLVLLKSELQTALLRDETMDRFKELAARKEQTTFLTCTADPSALDVDLLRIYMGDMADTKSAASALTLSFREMTTKVTALEDELKDLRDMKVTTLETTVKTLTDKSNIPKVSFHAVATHGNNIAVGSYIIFNQVWSNIANGYNCGNGVFTAPETGTYMFMATIRCNTNGSNAGTMLYVKGSPWAYTQAPDSCTVHATVSLNKGEQVWVQCGPSYNFYNMASFTSFTGALIAEL